ncbi:hypothetical protein K1719_020309 [Acacia pycnantha]|nr:hypothetical protein K1719_020309 [Acacia pycnantha]
MVKLWKLYVIVLKLMILQACVCCEAVDPTQGFSAVALDSSNFEVQKPYDVPVNQRYSFSNGVHRDTITQVGCGNLKGMDTWQVEQVGSPVLLQNMYDRWFRLNVIHDVAASNVKIYIDGVLKYNGAGRGQASHYFKFGVYTQNDPSHYMESRWKDIKLFRK